MRITVPAQVFEGDKIQGQVLINATSDFTATQLAGQAWFQFCELQHISPARIFDHSWKVVLKWRGYQYECKVLATFCATVSKVRIES